MTTVNQHVKRLTRRCYRHIGEEDLPDIVFYNLAYARLYLLGRPSWEEARLLRGEISSFLKGETL